MNAALYAELRRLGVFHAPAAAIARTYPGGEYVTRKVITAFLAHVRETESLPLAVWRVQNRILLTGAQRADRLLLTRR